MKEGWSASLLLRGFWNLPRFTSSGDFARASTEGNSASTYGAALEDMDAGDKLRSKGDFEARK